MKTINNERGFTLIEVMIASAILAVGILVFALVQTGAIRSNNISTSITGKANWAADQVEKLVAMNYDDLAALDVDGDGTNQDPLESGIDKDENNDGVLDANENFGLHHNTAATADGNATSQDANATYSIFWNVAVDTPIPNTVTVHVITTSKKLNSVETVEFDYIKAKQN